MSEREPVPEYYKQVLSRAIAQLVRPLNDEERGEVMHGLGDYYCTGCWRKKTSPQDKCYCRRDD